MSRWTCLFLIALRLSIGWHFLFEGLHKIHSENTKDAEGSKAFSSEGYFREARGPLGHEIRKVIGDPDKDLIAKLEIPNLPATADRKDKPAGEFVPKALSEDMEAYRRSFVATYNLSEFEVQETSRLSDQYKATIGRWLIDEKAKIKRKGVAAGVEDAEFEQTVQERVAEFKKKLAIVEDSYTKVLPGLGKDVEKATLRTKKADAVAVRSGLQKDLDDQLAKYKTALAGIVLKDLTIVSYPTDAKLAGAFLKSALTPEAGKVPTALESQWNSWVANVDKRIVKLPAGWKVNADDRLAAAKARYIHYLADLDEHNGTPLATPLLKPRLQRFDEVNRLAAEPGLQPSMVSQYGEELKRLAAGFTDDIRRHSETLQYQAQGDLTAEQLAGKAVTEEKKTTVQRFDFATRYGLSLIGALLLLGLFTRIGALMGAGFLLMTNLLHPSLPWLPTSPMNEGNYVFVNKNLIEMLALLLIATTASGRWLGLDAIVHRVLFGSGKKPAAVVVKK